MLIAGINGSPNKDGNTKFLLRRVLDKTESLGAKSIILETGELLNDVKSPFCTVCSNPCSAVCYRDTKLEKGYDVLKRADGIVLASPVYFGNVSAQIKAFFDKTRLLRNKKILYNKIGAGITVGAAKYGGQETTMRALHDIMFIHGMIIVGDGYKDDDCGHQGVSARKPAKEDENAIERCEILGKRLVEVCKATGDLRK